MVKKGKLSRVEKFFIEGNTNLPVEDVAAELNRSVAIVQKYVDEIMVAEPTQVTQEATVDEPAVPGMLTVKDTIGTKMRNGKPVATVMTPAASEIADEHRQQTGLNKKLQGAIHKPRG
jgi:CBS domain-containing protein